jgi:4-amino-4-deoxy-L-arabinose transferase-like glycosyltransferase
MRGKALVALLFAVGTLALYAWRVGDAPVYASPDEMIIAINAQHVATTGRDLDGTLLPLYFRAQAPGDAREGWFMPLVFYGIALVLRVAPLSVASIRLPSVCVGVADVVLMFLVAEVLFAKRWLSVFAAVALALTPAHFILSRYALDYLYPVPFVLAWLLCVARYRKADDPRWLLAAGLCLGIGFYSYIAAVVMMPVYVVLTALVLWRMGAPRSRYAYVAAGFIAPALGAFVWLARHRDALSSTFERYELYDPAHATRLRALRAFLSFTHVEEMVTVFWSFFNPAFLFLTGDRQMMFSTRRAGVFLIAIAVLLVLGIRRVIIGTPSALAPILLLGFITAPLAAVLVPEPAAMVRAVELMPFAILLATIGLQELWSAGAADLARNAFRQSAARVAAITLLILIPVQFAVFARDYFGDYRERSAPWLGGNFEGALDALSARAEQQRAPAVYLATLRSTSGIHDIRNRWFGAYWRFCLIMRGRRDLLAKTARWDGQNVEAMPAGTLVLANIGDVPTESLVRAGKLKVVATIPEIRNDPFFVILER